MPTGKSQDIYDHVAACLRFGNCDFGERNEISMQCPGCGDEKGHFSLNSRNGLYNCFKCNTTGNLRPLMLQNREEWRKLVRNTSDRPSRFLREAPTVCSLGGEGVSAVLGGSPSSDKASLHRSQAVRALKYCLGRGMTNRQVKEYQVLIKPFDPRVYFPYWNELGEMVFWTARATNDSVKPKTLHSTDSDLPLFGRHMRVNRNEVVLVEGVFDHFVTPGSYAILGSNVTSSQIIQLREDNVKRIFLVLDPTADEQAQRTARKLGNFRFDVFPVILGGKRDPAECGRGRMANIVQTVKQHHPVRPQAIYFS